ncbi:MAG: MATE family multidrug resistance protein [Paracoccaceae bacterium]|jgi:MATE family multidrug resistance protein
MVPQMTYFAHARAILTLGLPLVGGQLGQIAIQVTDTVMVGWYSVTALAAVVLASSYFFVVFIVASGFAWAVVPLVAQAAEAGDDVQVRRVTRMGLWLSMMLSAALMPLMIWSGPILDFLGQEEAVVKGAQEYLRIAGWGLIPAMGVMVFKSYLAALERTRVVLWVIIAAALVNAGLNYLLIFGRFGFPELGIAGAAIASVAVHVVTVVLLVLYAVRAFPEHRLLQRLWRPDWSASEQVFRLGWPIGLTNLSESGLFAASALMMGWLGALPLAAHGIALQIASATFMFHLGLSNAATVRAGRAIGRKDPEHLRRGGIVAIALSVGFSTITVGIFLMWPDVLVGAFIDPAEPARDEIIAIGMILMVLAAIFQLTDGLQVMALGLLRGVQDTRQPMILAAISYWGVGFPSSYILGFVLDWQARGVWLGLVTGLGVAALLLLYRFWRHAVPQAFAASRKTG